jgi:hypothetical protein
MPSPFDGTLSGYFGNDKLEPQASRETMYDTVWTSLEPEKKPLFVPGGIAYVFV